MRTERVRKRRKACIGQCYVQRTYYGSENEEQDFPAIVVLPYVAFEWIIERCRLSGRWRAA